MLLKKWLQAWLPVAISFLLHNAKYYKRISKLVMDKTPRDTRWNTLECATTWRTRNWLALITMKSSWDRNLHDVAETLFSIHPFEQLPGCLHFRSFPPFHYQLYGLIISLSGEGNGNPLQYSCLENPMDREAW